MRLPAVDGRKSKLLALSLLRCENAGEVGIGGSGGTVSFSWSCRDFSGGLGLVIGRAGGRPVSPVGPVTPSGSTAFLDNELLFLPAFVMSSRPPSDETTVSASSLWPSKGAGKEVWYAGKEVGREDSIRGRLSGGRQSSSESLKVPDLSLSKPCYG